jgi:uncharacterized protein YbbC (DUF1343 family)
MDAVYLYPSLCLFEGTIISVGRGTPYSFEVFGHPDFKGFSYEFTPMPSENSPNPLYAKKVCRGVDLRDFHQTHPASFGKLNISWLILAYKTLGTYPHFFNDLFDRLAGDATLQKKIASSADEEAIRNGWQDGLNKFKEIRKKYLLYPE